MILHVQEQQQASCTTSLVQCQAVSLLTDLESKSNFAMIKYLPKDGNRTSITLTYNVVDDHWKILRSYCLQVLVADRWHLCRWRWVTEASTVDSLRSSKLKQRVRVSCHGSVCAISIDRVGCYTTHLLADCCWGNNPGFASGFDVFPCRGRHGVYVVLLYHEFLGCRFECR